ncbi:MAG: sensor histidine kinase [Cyclobacteriaceae bacterium]
MKIFSYENIWVRNIAFYAIMFGIFWFQNSTIPDSPGVKETSFIEELAFFTFTYLLIFAFNFVAVKKLLFAKKFKWFSFAVVVTIFVFASVVNLVGSWLGYPMTFISDVFTAFFLLLIGASVNIFNIWILENVIDTKKKLLRKEAELDFLKQQLSPHFLFNALNNLYGTSLATPQVTPEKILELSNLLRYQVESTSREIVKIERELDFIKGYLDYANYRSNKLLVTHEGTEKVKGLYLPPLLFLPLLENAIKYSAESDTPFIHIRWKYEEEALSLSIENSCRTSGSKINGTKIGFENLKKRLEILKIKHVFEVDKKLNNVFKINLKLWGLSTNA